MPDPVDSTPQPPAAPVSPLLQMIHSYAPTQLIYVAAKLGIADHLSTGPQSAEELAAAVRVKPQPLRRVLRGLVNCGVLLEEEGGRFALTALGTGLQSHIPGSLRGLAIIHGEAFYQAWGRLLHTVETGEIAFESVFEMDFFSYLQQHPESEENFNDFIVRVAGQTAVALRQSYDFSHVHKIVDLGGAFGTLLGPILEANPHLSGVVLDTAPVISGAQLFLESAGLAARCEGVAGNFFEAVPAGGDLYILSQVLHDWDDGRCEQILGNCRAAMLPTGKLLIIERLMPERLTQPQRVVEFDLNMLVLNSGRERTEAEYRALLSAAGFRLTDCRPLAALSLLEAEPVPAG